MRPRPAAYAPFRMQRRDRLFPDVPLRHESAECAAKIRRDKRPILRKPAHLQKTPLFRMIRQRHARQPSFLMEEARR